MFGEAAGDYLFHYTTLATAVEHILPTRTFRMSPFSLMRDPRESHRWGYSGVGSDHFADDLFEELAVRAEEQKANIKVMSLTRDVERPPPNEIFGRGFARPRLWEQYGGDHAGVCLGFDRTALVTQLETQLKEVGWMRHGDVEYEDAQLVAPHFDLDEALGVLRSSRSPPGSWRSG